MMRFSLIVIAICGISLRLVGATAECRINWDEGRPDVERVIESPRVLIELFEHSWGRPGLVLLKCVGLLADRMLVKCGIGASLPEWIPFQIALDVLTLLVIALAVRGSGHVDSAAQRGAIMILCPALWACSPGAIYWSHRFMAPTYAMLGVALTIALLQHSRSVPSVVGFAGAVAGFTFLTYPGTYVLLGCLGLAYSFNRSELIGSVRRFACYLLGIAIPLIAFEAGLRIASSYVSHPTVDYFTQLTQLSGTINHGNYEDAPFAVWFHITRFGDWVFAAAVAAVGLGLLARRFTPAGIALGMTLAVWIVNSTVLHREVLYDRVLVLATPALIVAVGELAARAIDRIRWIRISTAAVTIVGPLLTFAVISNGDVIRVREADVRRFVAQSRQLNAGDVRLISDIHDYGPMADLHEADLLVTLQDLSGQPGFENLFAAFNLRSDCYIKPDADRTERYETVPLLRLPAHGLDQDGHGRKFVSLTAHEPCHFGTRFDDIKVIAAVQLLQELQDRDISRSNSRPHMSQRESHNPLQ